LRTLSQFRGARLLALITLGMLACVTAAGARSGSTDDTSAKTPATTKTHKPTKTSTTSASTTKSAGKTHTASTGKHSSRKKRPKGQQKIDSERAQAIQEALIREHYLTGDANGSWNQSSEEAMRRYQADHGWQSKTVPDSRALISLGLGPSKDHLLNPESAMTTVPDTTRAEPMPTTSHTAVPSTTATPVPAGQSDPSSPQ